MGIGGAWYSEDDECEHLSQECQYCTESFPCKDNEDWLEAVYVGTWSDCSLPNYSSKASANFPESDAIDYWYVDVDDSTCIGLDPGVKITTPLPIEPISVTVDFHCFYNNTGFFLPSPGCTIENTGELDFIRCHTSFVEDSDGDSIPDAYLIHFWPECPGADDDGRMYIRIDKDDPFYPCTKQYDIAIHL